LDNRINCIKKVGRLVFVGAENGTVSVYDFYGTSKPPLAELQLQGLAMRAVVVDSALVQVVFRAAKLKKKKKEKDEMPVAKPAQSITVIVWSPVIT
jgi:hypothetical protein